MDHARHALWTDDGAWLGVSMREHGLLLVITALYAATSCAMSWNHPLPASGATVLAGLFDNFAAVIPVTLYGIVTWRVLVARVSVKPERPIRWLMTDLMRLSDRTRLANGALALFSVVIILISFSQLKRMIPVLNPFSWDEALSAFDRALFFGGDPWVLAHVVAGFPAVLTAVTGAYNFWLLLTYFVMLFACFSRQKPWARMQYLIALIFCWGVGGNLVATLFSSAGPVYFARIGLGDTYEPLMRILALHDEQGGLSPVGIQDVLWTLYDAPQSLNGISAFPSMHVASSVLMALYARRLHLWAGRAMGAFSAIILLGSVLLGWHYAVDGLAAIGIAFGAWWGAGRLMRLAPALVPARGPDERDTRRVT